MDANRALSFVPAEGIEQVLLAPIPPERKIAILLSAVGHEVKLEGLEGVVADAIKAQISRFNAKYDLAVQRRNERQKRYRDAKKSASSDAPVSSGNATPYDITRHNATQRDAKNPPESESESESESPQSPPRGGRHATPFRERRARRGRWSAHRGRRRQVAGGRRHGRVGCGRRGRGREVRRRRCRR